MVLNSVRLVDNLSMMWPRSFRRRQFEGRARARGLRGGWSLDSGALCPLTGKTWDLSRETEQKKAWNLFYKTKPKLLIAFPPGLDQDWSPIEVDLAANMCMSQYKAGRKFVFEHPASSLSWSLSCVKRLGDLSGIYSVDFDGMRLFTNSRTIDGLVEQENCNRPRARHSRCVH